MTRRAIRIVRTPLLRLHGLRARYRRSMDCQIIRDAHHRRGFTTLFRITVGRRVAGYGAVGMARHNRGVLQEFYLLPRYRSRALHLFRQLLFVTRARHISCQSNDALLTLMLYDCARNIRVEHHLFEDSATTRLLVTGARFRPTRPTDARNIFPHRSEPIGDWVVEWRGAIVATGGILTHYNPPYGDLHMEVAPRFRRRGFGSFIVQELKRIAYRRGLIPAARCNGTNVASRRTLERAGFAVCGRILTGRVATSSRRTA